MSKFALDRKFGLNFKKVFPQTAKKNYLGTSQN